MISLSLCSFSEEAHWLLCDFRYCTLLFSQAASILCLVAISYDRLLSILYPLRYNSIMTDIHFVIISSSIWLIAALNGIILPLTWKNSHTITAKIRVVSSCELIDSVSTSQFNFFVMPAAFVCSLAIVVIYAWIFKEAKKHFQKVKPVSMTSCVASIANEIGLDHGELANSHMQKGYPRVVGSTPTYSIEKVQDDTSNQSANHISVQINENIDQNIAGFEQQNEQQNHEGSKERRTATKHAMTFLIVIGSFYICWLPFLILLAIQTYGKMLSFSLFKIFEFSCYPAIFNSGLNPIIYSIKMKQFRSATKKLMRETFSS